MRAVIRSGSPLLVVAGVAALTITCVGATNAKSVAKAKLPAVPPGAQVGIFAGGCFWCTEGGFEKVRGVLAVTSGYCGGPEVDPSYEQVSSGATRHIESVHVIFDPKVVSYPDLVEAFWRMIDPTDPGGQFADRGTQYTSVIFTLDAAQRAAAEASKKRLADSGKFKEPIATRIVDATPFYPAEEYHQDYYKKNSEHYHQYRRGSGREAYLERVWGERSTAPRMYKKPPMSEIRQKLNPMQFEVTQRSGTEPSFKNEFWDNHQDGIYVDIVTGEPLFSSRDKFDSGTGWPSFTKPLEAAHVVELKDDSHFMVRTEVRSKVGDSHLGHLFPDGPRPTGLRYCINSASLRFIPKEKLAEEGYAEYAALF